MKKVIIAVCTICLFATFSFAGDLIFSPVIEKPAPGDMDMYCLSAIEKFDKLGPEKAMAITTEIALLGRGGLDINDPERKYTLRSLSGEFSGLQLASYMYVGIKRIDPNQDAGIDLDEEYSNALKLFIKGN